MKKTFVVLFALLSLLSVGCSSSSVVGPVSIEPSGESVAKVAIVTAKIGALGKTAAVEIPTRVLIKTAEATAADFTVLPVDTIQIGANQDTVYATLRGFKKGVAYLASIWTGNNLTNRQLNNSGYVSFTVPNADTFQMVVNLKAAGQKIAGNIQIAGTPAASVANRIAVTWSTGYWGQTWSDNLMTSFTPGSLASWPFEAIMPIPVPLPSGNIGYEVAVRISCPDSSYWSGSAGVNIYPSTNATLAIQLTYYGTGGALGKMTVVLVPVGKLDILVSFP